jgi:hypothetical protein
MANFNNRDTVWNACLNDRQRGVDYYQLGFRLAASKDGEELTLTHEGKTIAIFHARLLTTEALYTGLKNYSDNLSLV